MPRMTELEGQQEAVSRGGTTQPLMDGYLRRGGVCSSCKDWPGGPAAPSPDGLGTFLNLYLALSVPQCPSPQVASPQGPVWGLQRVRALVGGHEWRQEPQVHRCYGIWGGHRERAGPAV